MLKPTSMTGALEYPLGGPESGAVCGVAPGIYWLRLPLPFALDHINVWLFEDGGEWALVDTGIGLADVQGIWLRLFETLLKGAPIGRVVLTHFHPDHMGLAAWLQRRFGARVLITRREDEAARRIYALSDPDAGAAIARHFHRHGLDAERVAALKERGNTYRPLVAGLPDTVDYMGENDRLRIGGRDWRIIVGRGHAPEHACLYCPSDGLLIAGDQILPRISSNVSVRPEEPDGDPLAQYLESLERLDRLPQETLVMPSHGRVFRGLHTRIGELIEHHEERLNRLRHELAARGPLHAAGVLPLLFDRELDPHSLFFAMGEAIAHLQRLWHAGEASRQTRADGVTRFGHADA